jgi:hypothetical protein
MIICLRKCRSAGKNVKTASLGREITHLLEDGHEVRKRNH